MPRRSLVAIIACALVLIAAIAALRGRAPAPALPSAPAPVAPAAETAPSAGSSESGDVLGGSSPLGETSSSPRGPAAAIPTSTANTTAPSAATTTAETHEAPKGRVFGTVLDEAGAPLAGVEVSAAHVKKRKGKGLFGSGKTTAEARTATSAVDGAYEITGLEAGSTWIRASSSSHMTDGEPIEVPEGGEVRHDLRLGAAIVISGHVQDAAQKPQAGIEVQVSWDPRKAVVTADDGAFRVAGLDPRWAKQMPVTTRDPSGHFAPTSGVAEDGMTITLEAAAALEVHVVARGSREPVEGATVSVTVAGGETSWFGGMNGGTKGTTDAAGLARISGLSSGKASVHAEAQGLAPATSDGIEVSPGAPATVTLELGSGGRIDGRVVSADGKPVPTAIVVDGTDAGRSPQLAFMGIEGLLGAAVEMGGEGDDQAAPEKVFESFGVSGRSATTDAGGRFALEHVGLGPRKLAAAAKGYVPAVATVEVQGDDGHAEVTITLGLGGAIEGTVRSKDGAPLPHVQLYVQSMTNYIPRTIETDEGGRYHVEGLAKGGYMVMRAPEDASKAGLQFDTKTVTVVEGKTAHLDIGGAAGAVVSGTIRRAGVLIEKGSALLCRGGASGFADGFAMTQIEKGRFRMEDVAPGAYELWIDQAIHRPIEIPAGAPEVPLDLDLPSHELSGTVADDAGQPLADAAVKAVLASDHESTMKWGTGVSAKTDAKGAFTLSGLDDGAVLVSASLEGYVPGQLGPIDAGSAEPIAFRLSRGGTIRAHIVGPDGEPTHDAFLLVDDGAGHEWGLDESTIFKIGGDPAVSGVPAGTFTVTAVSFKGSFDRKVGVVFDGRELALEFALGPGGTIEATARDAAGAPLAHVAIEVTFRDGSKLPATMLWTTPTKSGEDGVLRRDRLARGLYSARLVLDAREARFDFAIEDDQTTRVSVTVP